MNIAAKLLNEISASQIQQYIKKFIHQSPGIFPRDVRLVQGMQINKCDSSHKQNET